MQFEIKRGCHKTCLRCGWKSRKIIRIKKNSNEYEEIDTFIDNSICLAIWQTSIEDQSVICCSLYSLFFAEVNITRPENEKNDIDHKCLVQVRDPAMLLMSDNPNNAVSGARTLRNINFVIKPKNQKSQSVFLFNLFRWKSRRNVINDEEVLSMKRTFHILILCIQSVFTIYSRYTVYYYHSLWMSVCVCFLCFFSFLYFKDGKVIKHLHRFV